MTRRQLFGTIASIAGALGFQRLIRHETSYGFLNIEMARERDYLPARVLLDGMDVGNDCVVCDDRAGYVVLMKQNAAGKHYIDRFGAIAKERRHGVVEFIPNGHAK